MRCSSVAASGVTLALALTAVAQQGVNQKQGFNASNVYSVHDIDTVNAFNGNLTVAIPIGPEFPLAEGFSYRLTLHGNANFWDNEVRYDTYAQAQPHVAREIRPTVAGVCDKSDGFTVAFPHRRANAGLGWMLTLGRLYPPASTLVRGWTYQSADGADHAFHQKLVHGETDNDTIYYTRDGSYLRLDIGREAQNIAVIEFPDGAYHTFTKGANSEDPWLPIEIAHRRSNKKLTIDYSVPNEWKLTDGHGREHVIAFESTLRWESGYRPLVRTVTVAAFTPAGAARRTATYTFNYQEAAQLPRPDWHEPCAEWPGTTRVQMLRSITLPNEPDESAMKFEFEYDPSPLQSPGVLSKAVLPTGGWIRWYWDTWEKPVDSAGKVFLAESVGVVKRETWKPPTATTAAVLDGEWTYDSNLDANNTDTAVSEVHTAIKDPLNQTTVYFFSASVRDGTRDGVTYRSEYYGLPFTQKQQSGGRYLSQVVYPAGVTPDYESPLTGALRATYLLYEGDGAAGTGAVEKNWRVKQTRVVTFVPSGVDEWTDTDNSDFDGYGHYRTTQVSGSFGTQSRTTTTSYRAPGTHWILGLHDSIIITDANGHSATTEFEFEDDGFLKRTRRRRGSAASTTDLVTVYDDSDGDGMVDAQRHYGGDAAGKALAAGYDIGTNADPATPVSYSLSHTNANGVRASTKSDGATFKSLDLDIDLTGILRSSTDVTETYTTTFDYNLKGQLRSVTPEGEAWTEYEYTTNTSSFPPASVIVKQWPSTNTSPAADDTALQESRYYYDYFGRLIQERTWLSTASSSTWSVVSHDYDKLGRRVATTVPSGAASGAYATITQVRATRTDYDALGRVKKVTQPDGTYVETIYTGASTIERSVSMNTTDGDRRITTKETYDPLGRLVSVAEDFGGVNERTVYAYDEGDRLASVTHEPRSTNDPAQASRRFSYDGAGLLTEEQHPESGTTTYSYDARGNVIQKVTPTATVVTTYDAAERVLTMKQSIVRGPEQIEEVPLQSFTYGTTGSAKGRLQKAVRHNHTGPEEDFTVTETFRYDGKGGRLSQKTTAVSNGLTFTDRYTYDELGARDTITYPDCIGCGTLTPPARTVTNTHAAGFLTGVTGYTNKITYHPNGLLATLKRTNANGLDGPTFTQTIDAANRMARPASTAVTGTCQFEITMPPPSSSTVTRDAPANISVTAPGATTYEWYVLGSTTKIAGQTSSTLTIPVSQTTHFWVRVGNGTCTVDSGIATVHVQSCVAPDVTVTVPATVGPAAEASATVAGEGSYSWSIASGTGTIISGQNAQTVTFRSACSGPVSLTVEVTAACGARASSTKSVAVTNPSVTVGASPASITEGQSTTLSVSLAGGPWSVTWSDGFVQNGVTGSASRSGVSPSQTTVYSVTAINGCPGSYASTTVTVAPHAPVATNAARGAGGIQITWSMPPGATTDSFIIERCANACTIGGTAWTPIGTAAISSHVDTAAATGNAYVYRVRSVKAGTASTPGPTDFATNIAFTDDPIIAGSTVIRLEHLSELRAAVNALRLAAGLAQAGYTDSNTAGLPVRAVHFTELQSALNAARSQLGFAPVSFDPPLREGTMVRAAHVNQLRGGVR